MDSDFLWVTGILAYSRSRNFFYLYYVLRTLTAMVCEGSVHCLALAYVVSLVPDLSTLLSDKLVPIPYMCTFVPFRFTNTSKVIE